VIVAIHIVQREVLARSMTPPSSAFRALLILSLINLVLENAFPVWRNLVFDTVPMIVETVRRVPLKAAKLGNICFMMSEMIIERVASYAPRESIRQMQTAD
jgi:hypothetical protein